MGGDQVQMLQAEALLHLLQGNCWWRGSSSAAIIVGLQCRQGNPLQQVKWWNRCIILTGQESGDQGRSGLWVAHDTRTMGGFLGFLAPLHQSVVEAKRRPLLIIHSLWPSDRFNLIKCSSCCRARRTRKSSRSALEVPPLKSCWPRRKPSTASQEALWKENHSVWKYRLGIV